MGEKSEITILYNVSRDMFQLMKDNFAGKNELSDDDWTAYVDEVIKLSQKYKIDKKYLTLFEDMCHVLEKYELTKEGKKIEGFRLYEK